MKKNGTREARPESRKVLIIKVSVMHQKFFPMGASQLFRRLTVYYATDLNEKKNPVF